MEEDESVKERSEIEEVQVSSLGYEIDLVQDEIVGVVREGHEIVLIVL